MSRRKSIQATAKLKEALLLEKQQDFKGAIALYEKAVKADPANPQGWNRLMIAYRRTRTPLQEAKLIKDAIVNYQQAVEIIQQDWISKNQNKVDSSRELATALGLLTEKGLPKSDDPTIERWRTRLYLLEYRIRARHKKPETTKAKQKAKLKGKPKPKAVTKT